MNSNSNSNSEGREPLSIEINKTFYNSKADTHTSSEEINKSNFIIKYSNGVAPLLEISTVVKGTILKRL